MSYVIQIREKDVPNLPYPFQTMSFQCSDDGRGRNIPIIVKDDGTYGKMAGIRGDGSMITESLSEYHQESIRRYLRPSGAG